MLSPVCCMRLFPTLQFQPQSQTQTTCRWHCGCVSAKPADSVAKQVSQLSINQSASGQATASSQPTQTASVLSMQSSDQQGNQQPGRNRKKGKNNNRKGGNRNENASNNNKNGQNAGGDKQAKRKVKFPCKLFKDDHLTYLRPRIEEASRFLAQGQLC